MRRTPSPSLFDKGETFKSFEVGWTTGSSARFFNNTHVTFYQIDEREEAGTPAGHGVAFHTSRVVDEHWLPFLRAGWAEAGDSLYETAVSTGFGYSQDISSSLFGLGVGWSRPNEDTFGSKLDDQVSFEAFQRWQLTESIELTPSMQYLINPALNPTTDSIALFGLRFRAAGSVTALDINAHSHAVICDRACNSLMHHFGNRNVTDARKPQSGPPSGFSA
jgi:porin